MNSSIPQTCIHFSDELFLDHTEDPTALHDFDTQALIQCTTLGKFLGNGSFGAAYLCNVDALGDNYVIKLPCNLMQFLFQGIFANAQGLNLGDILTQFDNRSYDTYGFIKAREEGARNLNLECQNAEAILQPPVYRLTHRRVGSPITELHSDTHRHGLIREMDQIKRHPGYAHWHPVFHADFNIPCILSAVAEGSLHELIGILATHYSHESSIYFRAYNSSIPTFWLAVAHQVGNALQYMNDNCDKVHCDLKPQNILYKFVRRDDGSMQLHLWVSDYGLCMQKSSIDLNTNQINGTPLFSPDPNRNALWYGEGGSVRAPPAFAVTIFQYMMTLLTCLIIQQNPSGPLFMVFEDRLPWKQGGDILQVNGDFYHFIRKIFPYLEGAFSELWTIFLKLVFHTDPRDLDGTFNTFMTQLCDVSDCVFPMPMPAPDPLPDNEMNDSLPTPPVDSSLGLLGRDDGDYSVGSHPIGSSIHSNSSSHEGDPFSSPEGILSFLGL